MKKQNKKQNPTLTFVHLRASVESADDRSFSSSTSLMEITKRGSKRAMVNGIRSLGLMPKLVGLLTCISISASAHAVESMLEQDIAQLPLFIRTVKDCGQWQDGQAVGYHRVIAGDVMGGAGSELYVQWIRYATQEQPAALAYNTPIRELNNDHAQYMIRSVDCVLRGRLSVVVVKALYEHDQDTVVHEWRIELLGGGRYKARETKKK